jgi:hypothetical protein
MICSLVDDEPVVADDQQQFSNVLSVKAQIGTMPKTHLLLLTLQTLHAHSHQHVLPVLHAAMTELTLSQYNTLWQHHVLPPNLLRLTAGNAEAADCLLPLKQLEQLTLQAIERNIMPAVEMQKLTSLTSLTYVELTYWGTAADIDRAAAGWRAVPLQDLTLAPNDNSSLSSSTLQQLSSVTGLAALDLSGCSLGSFDPREFADVLAQLDSLSTLRLRAVTWQEPQDAAEAAGSSSPLAKLLQGLAAHFQESALTELSLVEQHVGRTEASAIAEMQGLQELQLQKCHLEDCSVADIVLKLEMYLESIDLSNNPGVTDACLPVLAHALRGIRASSLRNTSVTKEGLRRYLPSGVRE